MCDPRLKRSLVETWNNQDDYVFWIEIWVDYPNVPVYQGHCGKINGDNYFSFFLIMEVRDRIVLDIFKNFL